MLWPGHLHVLLRRPRSVSHGCGDADVQILASASYDSHIHLLFDDPDSDWLCFQKLHPKRPQTAVTLPSTSPLVPILFPSPAELEADEAIKLPPLEEDETVWCLAWAPGGQYLASGGDNGGIRIWSRQYVISTAAAVEMNADGLTGATSQSRILSNRYIPPPTPDHALRSLGRLAAYQKPKAERACWPLAERMDV